MAEVKGSGSQGSEAGSGCQGVRVSGLGSRSTAGDQGVDQRKGFGEKMHDLGFGSRVKRLGLWLGLGLGFRV